MVKIEKFPTTYYYIKQGYVEKNTHIIVVLCNYKIILRHILAPFFEHEKMLCFSNIRKYNQNGLTMTPA